MNEAGLLEQYRPMVLSLARKHRGCGLDFDDLVQEGTIGLIKAIRRYDPTQCSSLGPYAKAWIRGEILQAITRNKQLITGTEVEVPVSDNVEESIHLLKGLELLPCAMETLNKNQTAVIQGRWLKDSPAKLRELSAEVGVSIERIRQIEIASVAKLKDAMTELGYTS